MFISMHISIAAVQPEPLPTINQLKHSAPFVKILKLLINFVVNVLSVILVSVTAQLRMSELEEALVLSSIR